MEIYKIKRNGCEVNVIFTGKQYIFHNSYFGILAVATRKADTYSTSESVPLLRRRFPPFLPNGDTSEPQILRIVAALHRRRLFLHVRQVR